MGEVNKVFYLPNKNGGLNGIELGDASGISEERNGNNNHNESPSVVTSAGATGSATTTINNDNDNNDNNNQPKRDSWGSDIEFLMSCIALSVGLGNVWRFPFAALENGGGAFLIPYLIVLLLVGKPLYYLEMIIGQFSSRGSIKAFCFSPAMKGIGYGQVLASTLLTTYYASLLALTLRYFLSSFHSTLPWSYCKDSWNETCINSSDKGSAANVSFISDSGGHKATSAELYFYKDVLKETNSIDNGIGIPNWQLVLCLAFSWLCVSIILYKGIQSSGKMSYFLAMFPYVTMGVLLVRAVTLPGAAKGILYFITPQWGELLNPKVWFSAVTQVFFSISVCLGLIIMYASFNRFNHNIYRDAMIVTSLDTVTSVISGVIIFGILGNLAHETGVDDIRSVVKGGTGLAFVSYPDAIAKFEFVPQIFSIVFFFMLFILGLGSNVGLCVTLTSVLRDQFKSITQLTAIIGVSLFQFCVGLMYVTPGGQYLLNFIDYFGVSMIISTVAIFELIAISWIYGVKRLCQDIEFMLGIKTGRYWRICWAIITPGAMLMIMIYQFVTIKPLQYNDYYYPEFVYIIGWLLSMFGIFQVPIWICIAVYQQKGTTFSEKFYGAFRPTESWGPSDPVLHKKYKEFIMSTKPPNDVSFRNQSIFHKIKDNIFG